jgi:hypothetical protein
MQFFILSLTFILSSCAVQMGKVPIIVKNLDQDEINYEELMEKKNRIKKSKEFRKDCLHVFLFIPTKLTLEFDTVLMKSCKNSNFSFDNRIYDEFFYFLYGKECVVNEHYCENT